MILFKRHHPPRFPRWLLRRMRNYQEDYLITGDLEEMFHAIRSKKGDVFERFRFWIQVFGCFS